MMGLDNPIHLAFLLIVLLLVFGAKRLPEMGQSLGSGLRGFKDAIGGEHDTPAAAVATPLHTVEQDVPATATSVPVATAPVAAPAASLHTVEQDRAEL